MKRTILRLLCVALFMLAAAPADAHNLSTTAALSLQGKELTVRVMDVYGAAVEGATATVLAAPPGEKKGQKSPLTEAQPGTYVGVLTPPGSDTYDITVEITVFSELFRGAVRVKAGEEMAETLVAMIPIDAPMQHSVWGPVLYGAAAVVLIAATVVALRRQRNGEVEEE